MSRILQVQCAQLLSFRVPPFYNLSLLRRNIVNISPRHDSTLRKDPEYFVGYFVPTASHSAVPSEHSTLDSPSFGSSTSDIRDIESSSITNVLSTSYREIKKEKNTSFSFFLLLILYRRVVDSLRVTRCNNHADTYGEGWYYVAHFPRALKIISFFRSERV